jgi:hypothetical protein
VITISDSFIADGDLLKVVIGFDVYESLIETLNILSDLDAMNTILDGHIDLLG